MFSSISLLDCQLSACQLPGVIRAVGREQGLYQSFATMFYIAERLNNLLSQNGIGMPQLAQQSRSHIFRVQAGKLLDCQSSSRNVSRKQKREPAYGGLASD